MSKASYRQKVSARVTQTQGSIHQADVYKHKVQKCPLCFEYFSNFIWGKYYIFLYLMLCFAESYIRLMTTFFLLTELRKKSA